MSSGDRCDWSRVSGLLKAAIRQRAFPGCVLLVARDGHVLYHQALGNASLFDGREMETDTFFDLASLTKPLATTLVTMQLVEEGRIGLTQPARAFVRGFEASPKRSILVRHLLAHNSGLPAYRPYYKRLMRIPFGARWGQLLEWLAAEPLVRDPGGPALYSDLGFLLLQRVIETICGEPLAGVVETLYSRLGVGQLFFPARHTALPGSRFAATELCPWRKRLLQGQVHDDNAFCLQGVAGHAGLFGTARGVFDLLQRLLGRLQGDQGEALLGGGLVRGFFTPDLNAGRPLGFDRPSGPQPGCGRLFSARTVGHLGFTGTSFWVDPIRSVVVVFLTNRVHPSRYNLKIRTFRPMLHDAVMTTLFPELEGRVPDSTVIRCDRSDGKHFS